MSASAPIASDVTARHCQCVSVTSSHYDLITFHLKARRTRLRNSGWQQSQSQTHTGQTIQTGTKQRVNTDPVRTWTQTI